MFSATSRVWASWSASAPRAESLAADLRDAPRAPCSGTPVPVRASAAPTVLLVLWTDPPMTAGGGTWMTTVLETACLRNVFARPARGVAHRVDGGDHRAPARLDPHLARGSRGSDLPSCAANPGGATSRRFGPGGSSRSPATSSPGPARPSRMRRAAIVAARRALEQRCNRADIPPAAERYLLRLARSDGRVAEGGGLLNRFRGVTS